MDSVCLGIDVGKNFCKILALDDDASVFYTNHVASKANPPVKQVLFCRLRGKLLSPVWLTSCWEGKRPSVGAFDCPTFATLDSIRAQK
jgi:hypothetical protein